MGILRNPFRGLVSGIVRLLVLAAVLVAAYLIFLKPAVQHGEKTLDGAEREVRAKVLQALHSAEKAGNPKRLVKCIEHADGNAHKIQRCTVKF